MKSYLQARGYPISTHNPKMTELFLSIRHVPILNADIKMNRIGANVTMITVNAEAVTSKIY